MLPSSQFSPPGLARHHRLVVALAVIVLTIALVFAGNMAIGYLFILLGAGAATLVMAIGRGQGARAERADRPERASRKPRLHVEHHGGNRLH